MLQNTLIISEIVFFIMASIFFLTFFILAVIIIKMALKAKASLSAIPGKTKAYFQSLRCSFFKKISLADILWLFVKK